MTSASAPATVLIVDIAGATATRKAHGDEEAARRLGSLLQELTQIVNAQTGRVLKSNGDDLLVVFNQESCASSAVFAAAKCHEAARKHDMALYAGIGSSPARLVEVLGRMDIDGMCVNIAARLHKLIPDQPNNIFLDVTTRDQLSPEQQVLCRSFGQRNLKGIGEIEVFSLDWDDRLSGIPTKKFSQTEPEVVKDLVLSIGRIRQSFKAEMKEVIIGRSSRCDFLLAELGVGRFHAKFVYDNGSWFLRDVSRNGTWTRLAGPTSETHLLGGIVPLPPSGAICLGRPFAEDKLDGTTIEFDLIART